MSIRKIKFSKNYGGPIHYLGNRFLTLPNLEGRMRADHSWLVEQLFIISSKLKDKKFERCFEPFAGSASWSLAAIFDFV